MVAISLPRHDTVYNQSSIVKSYTRSFERHAIGLWYALTYGWSLTSRNEYPAFCCVCISTSGVRATF